MPVTLFLIVFPMICSLFMFLIRNNRVRGYLTYLCTAVIVAAVGILTVQWFDHGAVPITFYSFGMEIMETVNHVILGAELVLMVFVTVLCFKYHKFWISLLSIVPTLMIAWLELRGPEREVLDVIKLDHLSILMCVIIGVIGCLIIVYAVGYMGGYHHHRSDVKDRGNFFFAILFLFIGAMFGFVMSASLLWIDFFWEITSVCSFLLIGYTREPEAITNSFRALWMNLLGGTALAIGIVYFVINNGSDSLDLLIALGTDHAAFAALPVALIAFAALTKSAQMPFSTWLMGAMVAPTPSSALLHSATMVKAGIYILLRLAPAMHDTYAGQMVSFVGGFTFFMASIMAITQSDGKKVLAFSTISNLGLMVACCGVGVPETIWAAVFLMMFHAVSKSLLFQDVGATENATGSRDIENMHGLLYRLPRLAAFMFIGIAGMFLAPFGMLISKWSALKAAVDDGNILLILFIAFGSATTGLYWMKWMGKIVSRSHRTGLVAKDSTKTNEMLSLSIHAVLMIALCVLLPIISVAYVDPLLVEMFSTYQDVLSMSILIMLVVIILFVFAIPVFAFRYNRDVATNIKLSYMSGINTGQNTKFTDSMGNEKKLWLSNLYFTETLKPDRMMFYSQLFAMVWLIVLMCMIIGGAIV